MSRARDPGRLRWRLQIERANRTSDGAGGWTVSWTSDGSLWAEPQRSSAQEVRLDGRVIARGLLQLRARYRGDLSPDDRLTRKGKVYSILSVVEDPIASDRMLVTVEEES